MDNPTVFTTVTPNVSYIRGTYDIDETVMLTVEVAGLVYTSGIDDELELRSNGVWHLNLPVALDDGYYDVKVTAASAVEDVLTDNTTNELGIGVPQITLSYYIDSRWSAPELESEILLYGFTEDVEDGQIVKVMITDANGDNYIGSAQVKDNDWAVSANTSIQRAEPKAPEPEATILTDGGWVITSSVRWKIFGVFRTDIYMERFSSDGELSPEGKVQINASDDYINDNYSYVDNLKALEVTALSDGGWLISRVVSEVDSDPSIIAFQRYAADGTQFSDLIMIENPKADWESASITAVADGGWMVEWKEPSLDAYDEVDGWNMVSQHFAADGTSEDTVTRNISAIGGVVTELLDGGWVVMWADEPNKVVTQHFTADGLAAGDRVVLDIPTSIVSPDITALVDGGWVIVWKGTTPDDGTSNAGGRVTYVQHYAADGMPEPEVIIQIDWLDGYEFNYVPSVEALVDGGWVVEWKDNKSSSEEDTFYQRFNADGTLYFEGDVAAVSDLDLSHGDTLTIEATVEDARGYTAKTTKDVTVDLLAELALDLGSGDTPPIISDGLDALVISGTTLDVERSKKVEITLTDVLGNTVDGHSYTNASGLWSQSFDVSGFVDGAVTIDAYVRDIAGNRGEISETAFVLDQPITLTLVPEIINAETTAIGGAIFGGNLNADDQQINITITDELGNQFVMSKSGNGDSWYSRIDGFIDTQMLSGSATGLVDGGWLVSHQSDSNAGFQRFSAEGEYLETHSIEGTFDDAQVLGLPDGGWVANYVIKDAVLVDSVRLGPGFHGIPVYIDLYQTSYQVVQERFDSNGNLLGSEVIYQTPQGFETFDGPYTAYYQPSQPLENLQISEDATGGWEASWYNTTTEKTLSLSFDAAGNATPEGAVEVAATEPADLTIELADGGWLTFNDDYSFYQRFNADGSGYLHGDVASVADLADGMVTVEITITDAETGEIASTSKQVALDRVAEITIDPLPEIVADGSEVIVSGTVTGVEDGQRVIVYDDATGERQLDTAIVEGGVWSTAIDYNGARDGTVSIQARVSDVAGNEARATPAEFILDQVALTQAPTVDLRAITNPTNGVIVGTYDYKATDNLTVTANGVTHTLGEEGSKLTSNGYARWILNAPDEGWQEGTYDVVATTVDANGYTLTDNTINEFIVDLTVPDRPTVNTINTTNKHPWVSGTFDSEDSEIFTVTVDGNTYTLGEDDNLFQHANNDNVWVLRPVGNYSLGTHDVVATSTDIVGRVRSDNSSAELSITKAPSITIENPTTDIIAGNLPFTLGGIADGVEAGQLVTVTFTDINNNTHEYTTPVVWGFPVFGVDAYLFSLTLTATDIDQLQLLLDQGSLVITTSVTNLGGHTAEDSLIVADGFGFDAPTVNSVTTSNTYTWLSGVFDSEKTDKLTVTVDGKAYTLGEDSNLFQHANHSNTWVLKPQGFYHLGEHDVVAQATDASGNIAVDQTTGELTITRDMIAPRVNGSKQIYNTRPAVGGYFDEAATEELTVALDDTVYTLGVDAELTSNGPNSWVLNLMTLDAPLADGVYDVIVNTTDANNITLQDASTDELTIGMLAPTVTEAETTNFKPVLSGFYDSDFANGLTVTVNGDSYTLGVDSELSIHSNNDDVWKLQLLQRLDFGDNDIQVTVTDTRGKDKTDITSDEIHIYQIRSQAVHGDVLVTQEGNDTITINDSTFSQISAGAGVDTLLLDGNAINLNFANIQSIDVVDLNDATSTANTLTLNLEDVLTKTDNSSLSVLGDSADTVTLAIADSWTANGSQVIDGVTYDGYDSGAASLLIEQGVAIDFVA